MIFVYFGNKCLFFLNKIYFFGENSLFYRKNENCRSNSDLS